MYIVLLCLTSFGRSTAAWWCRSNTTISVCPLKLALWRIDRPFCSMWRKECLEWDTSGQWLNLSGGESYIGSWTTTTPSLWHKLDSAGKSCPHRKTHCSDTVQDQTTQVISEIYAKTRTRTRTRTKTRIGHRENFISVEGRNHGGMHVCYEHHMLFATHTSYIPLAHNTPYPLSLGTLCILLSQGSMLSPYFCSLHLPHYSLKSQQYGVGLCWLLPPEQCSQRHPVRIKDYWQVLAWTVSACTWITHDNVNNHHWPQVQFFWAIHAAATNLWPIMTS